jgi:hypothetical protein
VGGSFHVCSRILRAHLITITTTFCHVSACCNKVNDGYISTHHRRARGLAREKDAKPTTLLSFTNSVRTRYNVMGSRHYCYKTFRQYHTCWRKISHKTTKSATAWIMWPPPPSQISRQHLTSLRARTYTNTVIDIVPCVFHSWRFFCYKDPIQTHGHPWTYVSVINRR